MMTDDEQKQQIKSFVKQYGSPIVTGVLLALCVFFGWQWWTKKQDITASNLTVQYQSLLNQVQAAEDDPELYKKLEADANKLIAENPKSAQAVQTQVLLAKLAFDAKDYEAASKLLADAQSSSIKDEGLKAIAGLRLAYVQMAQNQLDDALKTLDTVKVEAFIPSVAEARGDVYVGKNDQDAAIKAYQQAWDVLVEREQPRELLQLKLANLGVLVEEPKLESPIITPSTLPSES